MSDKGKLVLGVIGADCHAVGNKILEAVLRDYGFDVANLRVMVSQDEFIDAALETGADAIIVSSLYGHGEIDCQGLREHCVERGLEDVILYVGGNLVVGKTPPEVVTGKFKAMGFDRVWSPDTDLSEMCKVLDHDIREKKQHRQH